MTETEWLACEDPERMLKWFSTPKTASNYRSYPDGWKIPGDRKLRLFACACARATDLFAVDDGSARLAVETAERFADGSRCKTLMAKFGGKPENTTSLFKHAVLGSHCCEESPIRAARYMTVCEDGPSAIVKAVLLRDIVGNPFRPVKLSSGARPACRACDGTGRQQYYGGVIACEVCDGVGRFGEPGPCPWFTPTVLSLAQAAYEHRNADGTLDPARLAVLSDALEEAGGGEEVLTIEAPAGVTCPDCGDQGFWRSGQEFDHMRKCRRQECGTVWVPGKVVKMTVRTPNAITAHLRSPGPHVRGCWALDLILGKE